MCSVSTSSTVVGIYSPIQAQAVITGAPLERLSRSIERLDRPAHHPEEQGGSTKEYVNKFSSPPDDYTKTSGLTAAIEDRYTDIQRLMELLLCKLHHLPELYQKPEEMDISEGLLTRFSSCISKVQRSWKRSSAPPVLPL